MDYGICRFCLKLIKESNSEPIDEIIKEIVEVLRLKLNLNISKEPRSCHSCIKELETLFEFKSTCLYTEDYIYPLRSAGGPELDLHLIYAKENNLNLTEISNQKVCRFCMQLITESNAGSLRDIQQDVLLGSMLQKHFPEIEFGTIKDPVYCSSCFGSLHNYFIFALNCASVEDKIQQYCDIEGTNSQRGVSLHDVVHLVPTAQSEDAITKERSAKLGDSLSEDENEGCVFREVENITGNIKNEQIEIKSEPGEYQSFEEPISLPPPRKTKQKHSKPNQNTSNCAQKCIIKLSPREKALYKCKLCPYSTNFRYRMDRHKRVHEKSKQPSDEANHDASPKGPPNVLLYRCDKCSYGTHIKYLLRRHIQVVHDKGIGDVKVYRCENCDYTTKYSSSFAKHVVHMPRSKVTMFKCHHCKYESRYRFSVQKHIRNEHMQM